MHRRDARDPENCQKDERKEEERGRDTREREREREIPRSLGFDGRPAPGNPHNASDRAELEKWARDPATALGEMKDFRLSRERRWYLHQVCDSLKLIN